MRSYFKRLSQHPGIGPAFLFTIFFYAAALSNKHGSIKGGLILGTIASAVIWLIVLTTVQRKEKKKEPPKIEDPKITVPTDSFPRAFIIWYSGMKEEQIDNAYKRWKRETEKQK